MTPPTTAGGGRNTSARRLAGRAAVIIGASSGIGAATAEAFVAEGARVVIAARRVDALNELAARMRTTGGDVRVVRTDVTDHASIVEAIDCCVREFGQLDIAVNNAAVNSARMPFDQITDELYRDVMATNVDGVVVAMRHQIRAMLQTGGGSIINTASIGSFAAVPNMSAYVASKHAVLGLTKAAAFEYASRKIRINAVAPGAVWSDMTRAGSLSTPTGQARIEAATPMARIGEPREIAAAIVWLASDESSFVTGVALPVDGGYLLP